MLLVPKFFFGRPPWNFGPEL